MLLMAVWRALYRRGGVAHVGVGMLGAALQQRPRLRLLLRRVQSLREVHRVLHAETASERAGRRRDGARQRAYL